VVTAADLRKQGTETPLPGEGHSRRGCMFSVAGEGSSEGS
jgi:hypothetical protein